MFSHFSDPAYLPFGGSASAPLGDFAGAVEGTTTVEGPDVGPVAGVAAGAEVGTTTSGGVGTGVGTTTSGGVGTGVGTTTSGGAGAVVGGAGEVAGANAGTIGVSFASAGAVVWAAAMDDAKTKATAVIE